MKAEQEDSLKEKDDLEFISLKKELKLQLVRNELLVKENQQLRQEVANLKTQITSLKAHNNERKSILWKKMQNCIDNNNSDAIQQKPVVPIRALEQGPAFQNWHSKSDFQESANRKETPIKVPTPPPRPTSAAPSLCKEEKGDKMSLIAAPPPPPAPTKSRVGSKAVRRVPEVIELYRSLTRKDTHMENRTSPNGLPTVAFTRNMIGEIENRSTYLSAIKSDVRTQGEFIRFLIKEVETASYADIYDVEAFVKWLDGNLSSLVDERAVLKHFPQWPEQKADAMREAACSYRDLKNLESEVLMFEDNPNEPLNQDLRRIQTLQDRLESSVSNTERTRESTSKQYRNFQIPSEWMLDTGLIGQMKLCSLRLARKFMQRITKEIQSTECLQEDNLMVQGVRFAFRVHQFAGGFNEETIQAFEDLKKQGNGKN
ncbi:Protein CHUP1, chloroplastic [Quillaja saponaria]|uniref:Protein CHUP1, chloroplastic n=1 Tax=Quillaja saponaria TaxID=32244 RepID=A0AAD7LKH9_QUISA|nr:Protein CHUP1, chloroplastic [Quillaja saponaria]